MLTLIIMFYKAAAAARSRSRLFMCSASDAARCDSQPGQSSSGQEQGMAIRLDWRLLCGAASVVASVVPAAIAQETTVLEEITVIESAGNGEKGALTTTAEREEIERKMVGDVTDLGRVDASVGFSASTK